MESTRILKSVAVFGMAVLLLGAECMATEVPPPPGRALHPAGTIVRGPFYPIWWSNGKDYGDKQLDPTSVTITPADDVGYDVVRKQFQFLALGTYKLSVIGEQPAVTSTITVVDGPTFLFDMAVDGNRDIYSQTLYGFNFTRLTTDAADDVWPTGASNGDVVFTSYRDGNGELYRQSPGAAAPVRLTSTAANETEAQLSPDGLRIAYVRDDGGKRRVWLSRADGSSAAMLTNAGPEVEEGHPRWYLTSDLLLMTSTAGGGTAIYRTFANIGSTPTPFAVPATKDSIYDDPDVRGLTSAALANGGMHWIASAPGGPRRALMASVYYDGSTIWPGSAWNVTPLTVSVGEPSGFTNSATAIFTRFMPDGSTTIGYIGMTAPFPAFEKIWNPIPVPGSNPRHPADARR